MENFRREIPNNFSLPRRISKLGPFSYNLWWTWNTEGQALFAQVNRLLWDRLNHNPVAFLQKVERPRLNAMTSDHYYLDLYDRVMRNFELYMKNSDAWFDHTYPNQKNNQIVYFSFEFGLHEALPVYAGGLGILSGDHLKEASDLGMPLVAVGFMYNQGYFSQRITEDGWQESRSMILNFDEMPIVPLYGEDNKPLMISVNLPGRIALARLWEVQVGRVHLYLLDSDVDGNSAGDRQLTARLYGNDPEVRISQEIMLGMGGVRALTLLGCNPTIFHMNEGHSAFLAVERIRELMRSGLNYDEAADQVRNTNIFTTHTPVPAGIDQFPLWLIDKYLPHIWPELGLSRDQFIDLGRQVQPWGDTFAMPVLAMRLSNYRNAVSEVHEKVSRRMWQFLWPGKREDELPFTHVTNGIHTGTWLARRMRMLFERYLGPDCIRHMDDLDMWSQVENIPDGEMWAIHRHLKRKLVIFTNQRARQAWLSGSVHPVQVIAGGVLLEPYSLTLGFARRFPTYKRADLILRNFDRLIRIVNNPDRPVQIVFAGKSHPADEPGKLLIQKVYRAVKDAKTGGRLVFLEDYDMNMARYLVQGVDIWLNTPRRPNEASGTSGMKAALNGVLNASILDGWWCEAYNGSNGWAIGDQTEYPDANQQDDADAESLFDVLENEIVPLYYSNRTTDNIPIEWVTMMKESIRTLAPQFSTRRMLKEYMGQLYLPALESQLKPEEEIQE